MRYNREKRQAAFMMRRLYRQGLTTCSGGNISLRVGKDLALITPSALDKGYVKGRRIALITLDGKNLTPGLKISIESEMHLKILKARSDVGAVVHAHPKAASFFTAAGNAVIRTDLLAEAFFLLGEPAFAPYALMGTEVLGENVAAALGQDKTAVLLENHGVLTVGATLLEAFDRMEVLEAAAQMTLMAHSGSITLSPLSPARKKDIEGLR